MFKFLFAALLAGALSLGCATSPQPQPVAIDVVESFEVLRSATFKLEGDQGHCSGVFIEPKIMLTAAHCDMPNMSVEGVKAVVLKKSDTADIMLLFVNLQTPIVSTPKFESYILRQDQPVVVIGYPHNFPQFLTEGRLQGTFTDGISELDIAHYITVSAPVSFGNSGGPVFTKIDGKWVVIGIVSAVSSTFYGPVAHMMLAVHPFVINNFVRDYVTY